LYKSFTISLGVLVLAALCWPLAPAQAGQGLLRSQTRQTQQAIAEETRSAGKPQRDLAKSAQPEPTAAEKTERTARAQAAESRSGGDKH